MGKPVVSSGIAYLDSQLLSFSASCVRTSWIRVFLTECRYFYDHFDFNEKLSILENVGWCHPECRKTEQFLHSGKYAPKAVSAWTNTTDTCFWRPVVVHQSQSKSCAKSRQKNQPELQLTPIWHSSDPLCSLQFFEECNLVFSTI